MSTKDGSPRDFIIQYGLEYADGSHQWPDNDDHLFIPQRELPVFYVDGTNLDSIRNAVVNSNLALHIVQRTVTDPVRVPADPNIASEETTCPVVIWEDYLRMQCGYLIVNGACVRHGKVDRTIPKNGASA